MCTAGIHLYFLTLLCVACTFYTQLVICFVHSLHFQFPLQHQVKFQGQDSEVLTGTLQLWLLNTNIQRTIKVAEHCPTAIELNLSYHRVPIIVPYIIMCPTFSKLYSNHRQTSAQKPVLAWATPLRNCITL